MNWLEFTLQILLMVLGLMAASWRVERNQWRKKAEFLLADRDRVLALANHYREHLQHALQGKQLLIPVPVFVQQESDDEKPATKPTTH